MAMPVFAAGMRVTGALLNQLSQQIDALGVDTPHAFLRATANQSIPTGVWTAVNLDTEDDDTHGGHSTVTLTSRYTATVAGDYRVQGRGSFASNATGSRGVRIAKGGTAVPGSGNYKQTNAVNSWADIGSCDVHLAVGEYVEVHVSQDSGGALNTAATAGDVAPSMSVELINRD